jgi:hypothetical protein
MQMEDLADPVLMIFRALRAICRAILVCILLTLTLIIFGIFGKRITYTAD